TVAQGHFRNIDGHQEFRLSGTAERFEVFGESGPEGRGIGIFEPYVEEGARGPSVELQCKLRLNEDNFGSRQYPVIPFCDQGDSVYLDYLMLFALDESRFNIAEEFDRLEFERFLQDKE